MTIEPGDTADDQIDDLTTPGESAEILHSGLKFRVIALGEAPTGRLRYRVDCLVCGGGVADLTSAPLTACRVHAVERHAELLERTILARSTELQRARWARAARADGRSLDAWAIYVLDLAAATIEEVQAEKSEQPSTTPGSAPPPIASVQPAEVGAVARLAGSRELQVWADGACRGNPGPAGVGVVIVGDGDPASRVELAEFIGGATNNIAELTAIERGLREAQRILRQAPPGGPRVRIVVHSDSEYAIGVLTHREWRLRANASLIQRVRALVDELTSAYVEFVKVAGHAGVPLNERADALAGSAIPV